MAPGGWIRVWFQTWDRETEKQVSVEVAKAKLKGSYDHTSDESYKVKSFENWGKYYTYWQLHGIPYEAWANNEKEYDIVFDFYRNEKAKVGFNYISLDGTYYQSEGYKVHQKLPAQLDPIAWLDKSGEAYECRVPLPKTFKKYIEEQKLKKVYLILEIEKDDQHAVIYLITNNSKEKILRFKSKKPTKQETEKLDFAYATEVEYFIQ